MAVKEKLKLTHEEFDAFLILENMTVFILAYWGDDMQIPPSRKDLPSEYHSYQHVICTDLVHVWQDYSIRKLVCTSRKIGKTLYLEAFNVQRCLLYTGETVIEAMFFAPKENHIKPVLNRLYARAFREPLFKLFIRNWNRTDGIVNFYNNVVLHLRIEGSQGGQNMIGLRARLFMVGDEMAYGSQEAHDERQNTATPECEIMYCGVPNGVRTTPFYALDQTGLGRGYSKHKYNISANPLYHSDKAVKDELQKHGNDENSQSWITQVWGLWGQEAYSSFPVIPIYQDKPPFLQTFVYKNEKDDTGSIHLAGKIKPPRLGHRRYILFGDIGYSPSPTELGIGAELEANIWAIIARITLQRFPMPEQAGIIDSINREVLPNPATLIGIDAHGQGSGVLQSLHSPLMEHKYGWFDYQNLAFDVGFATSLEEKAIQIHRRCGSPVRMLDAERYYCDACKAMIWSLDELKHPKLNAKQIYTTRLKAAFEVGQKWLEKVETGYMAGLLLSQDDGLIEELEGTTEQPLPVGAGVRYIPPVKEYEHRTDMVRCCIATLMRLEEMEGSETEEEWLSEVMLLEAA